MEKGETSVLLALLGDNRVSKGSMISEAQKHVNLEAYR
jgi:hypothetical protein